jgi:hypothetical protein
MRMQLERGDARTEGLELAQHSEKDSQDTSHGSPSDWKIQKKVGSAENTDDDAAVETLRSGAKRESDLLCGRDRMKMRP